MNTSPITSQNLATSSQFANSDKDFKETANTFFNSESSTVKVPINLNISSPTTKMQSKKTAHLKAPSFVKVRP